MGSTGPPAGCLAVHDLDEQGKEPIEIRRVADPAANGRPVGLLETGLTRRLSACAA